MRQSLEAARFSLQSNAWRYGLDLRIVGKRGIGFGSNLIRLSSARAVEMLLGHFKIESTVRYLGIEVDDAIEMSEKIDIQSSGMGSARRLYF